jgi:enoyl-CoA hydratase
MLLSNPEGPIVTLTIDRPQVRNTLTPALIHQLTQAIRQWSADDAIRLIVLTGRGDRAFVGGVDVHSFIGMTPEGGENFITALHHCFRALRHSEKIVIASINGFTLGAGLELAASCDLRIASDQAFFGMPEVKVGLPSVIEAAYLPRLVGLGRAAEIVYTGEMIDAREAQRIGLVNRVVPHERLREATLEMAQTILANAPGAIRLQKRVVRLWTETSFDDSIQGAIKLFRQSFESPEPHEGAKAFLEKRKPSYGS